MVVSFSQNWQSLWTHIAEHPWLALVVLVSLQAIVITAVAASLVRFCRNDPNWSHRIWLSAVSLMLIIVPLHWFLGGWPVAVAQQSHSNNAVQAMELVGSVTGSASTGDRPDSLPHPVLHEQNPTFINTAHGETLGSLDAGSEQISPVREQGQTSKVTWLHLLLGGYVAGVLFCLVRLGLGAWKLRSLAARGRTLCDRSQQIVSDARRRVALRQAPGVRLVDGLSMPLTFGVVCNAVLVPNDFENWSEPEQQAVLLHEFTHVKRLDVLGELVARIMRAVYWFHPAGWYLARQIQLSRELATDQCVVESGEDPRRYANSLVAIMTHLGSSSNGRSLPPLSSVAMSAMGNVEDRLLNILADGPRRIPRFRGRVMIAFMVVIVSVTTVRLQSVPAQSTPVPSVPAAQDTTTPGDEPAVQTEAVAGKTAETDPRSTFIHPVRPGDNDLFNRIRDCDVLTVTGNEYHSILTVSGQVLSPTGKPVSGATVLLRESSSARISSEHMKYVKTDQRHLVRVQDVFARTTTDAEGRFHFDRIKSPALPKRWSNSWEGDLVAGHQELGIGWLRLQYKKERQRFDADQTIALRPTGTISGKFVAPSGKPLHESVVNIYGFESPSLVNPYVPTRDDFDLQLSQLMPRAVTDTAGGFRLTAMPMMLAANLGAAPKHPELLGVGAFVATSADLALGNRGRRVPWGQTLVGSPVTLVADAGVRVSGTVFDDSNSPVQGVNIARASSRSNLVSDEKGRFQLHLPTSYFDMAEQRSEKEMKFFIRTPEGSELLTRYVDFPVADLLSGKPLTVKLERGVKLSGAVVAEDGEPVADVLVRQLGDPWSAPASNLTDAKGEFEFYVPKGQHVLLIGTDEPGYQLPTVIAVLSAAKRRPTSGWMRRIVDVSDGQAREVEPFVLSRIKEHQVIASLPNGEPAVGASVVVMDKEPRSTGPQKIEISNVAQTNALGRASVLPNAGTTLSAFVLITLPVEGAAFRGTAQIAGAQAGVVNVVLQPAMILRGRVLLDGEPVPDATIAITQSKPFTRVVSGATVMGGTVVERHLTSTDDQGKYLTVVVADKRYSVTVQGATGDVRSSVGFSPKQVAPGVLEVKDFVFVTGTEEIAGVVVDGHGKPVVGGRVSIKRKSSARSSIQWFGYADYSHFETDMRGRFHLKMVPKGSYQLSVRSPRVSGQRSTSSIVDATSGDMNVEITIDSRPQPAIPRLQPKQVTELGR